jgi:hypothetical protein
MGDFSECDDLGLGAQSLFEERVALASEYDSACSGFSFSLIFAIEIRTGCKGFAFSSTLDIFH